MSPSVEPHPPGPGQHTVARGDERPTGVVQPACGSAGSIGSCLRPDVFAGLGVAAYLVPQVMAYATLAGLDPVVGLWACLLPLAIYALAGTSRLLSVGPESTTAIMTAAALAPLAAGDAATYATMAAFAALLVGVMCLLGGILRLGIVASLLSKPVLIGYLAGVAVIMIAGQLGKLFGITVSGGTPLTQIWSAVGAARRDATAPRPRSGCRCIVVLFIGSSRWPRVPWPLIAVLGATLATTWLDLEQYGVTVVGPVPERPARAEHPDGPGRRSSPSSGQPRASPSSPSPTTC